MLTNFITKATPLSRGSTTTEARLNLMLCLDLNSCLPTSYLQGNHGCKGCEPEEAPNSHRLCAESCTYTGIAGTCAGVASTCARVTSTCALCWWIDCLLSTSCDGDIVSVVTGACHCRRRSRRCRLPTNVPTYGGSARSSSGSTEFTGLCNKSSGTSQNRRA